MLTAELVAPELAPVELMADALDELLGPADDEDDEDEDEEEEAVDEDEAEDEELDAALELATLEALELLDVPDTGV